METKINSAFIRLRTLHRPALSYPFIMPVFSSFTDITAQRAAFMMSPPIVLRKPIDSTLNRDADEFSM